MLFFSLHKIKVEVQSFLYAHCPIMFYIVPSFVKISQKFSKLLSGHLFQTKISKGHNALKM